MFKYLAAVAMAVASVAACAERSHGAEADVTLKAVGGDGIPTEVGTVRFSDSQYGLLVEPRLHGLSPGAHAAHIHEKGSCATTADQSGQAIPGGGAGDHFDPKGTKQHAGPYADGHHGDLPNLFVEHDGRAAIPVLAPRPKVEEIRGRALIIHGGADGYNGHGTHRHGMGGARAYCGVIE